MYRMLRPLVRGDVGPAWARVRLDADVRIPEVRLLGEVLFEGAWLRSAREWWARETPTHLYMAQSPDEFDVTVVPRWWADVGGPLACES